MTNFNSPSVLTAIAIILIYGIKILYVNIYKGTNSLKDSESIHKFIVFTGGALLGLALGLEEFLFSNSDNFMSDLFSILFIIGSVFLLTIGGYYLKSKLWQPLELIAEYSAEFGTNFVGTRLPIVGDSELKRFAERFNENTMTLAHKLSDAEIRLEMLGRSMQDLNQGFTSYSSHISDLDTHFNDFSVINTTQNSEIEELGDQISGFIRWYDSIQEDLSGQLADLRSISITGNLIAINASIEANNLEIEVPGFTTIAGKLHELTKLLDERQENLRILFNDIQKTYENFQKGLSKGIEKIIKRADDNENLISYIDKSVDSISKIDSTLKQYFNSVNSNLDELSEQLPNAF
jgi:hypothetical protein